MKLKSLLSLGIIGLVCLGTRCNAMQSNNIIDFSDTVNGYNVKISVNDSNQSLRSSRCYVSSEQSLLDNEMKIVLHIPLSNNFSNYIIQGPYGPCEVLGINRVSSTSQIIYINPILDSKSKLNSDELPSISK